jgi:hypothetical protein
MQKMSSGRDFFAFVTAAEKRLAILLLVFNSYLSLVKNNFFRFVLQQFDQILVFLAKSFIFSFWSAGV